jgi:signal transduction histidine kinase
MQALRDLPIRQKLVLIVVLSTGGALVLASAGLIAFDLIRFRGEMKRDLTNLADIIATNSTAALSFDDEEAAEETLSSLRASPPIDAASIYDENGELFARWVRDGKTRELPVRPEPDGNRFTRGHLLLFQPVYLDSRRLGTVYLESSLEPMYGRLRTQALTVLLVFCVSGVFAVLLSARFQRLISRPILHLAETAQAVSERQDYSIRAGRTSADELGRLVDAFNHMLDQIQARDLELLRAKEELEGRVEERTRELQQELGERRRAEAELAHRNEELRQSNKELDDFAYIASHDLKEPLRGIHNFSVFLLEDYADKLDEEGRSKLETLTRLSRRMEALIDSLLHFSRVGRVDLAIDRVDLNEILAEVLDSVGINLRELDVDVRIPRPLPVVLCDRARVGEIFYNLIVNAMKYNDKPEKWIEIGWRDHRPPVFYVRDNGIGIPEKHLDSIFRIFKRLHGRDKFGGGTGAGLTIVKKIVERHNGRIWVESMSGEGTTFYFTLEKERE